MIVTDRHHYIGNFLGFVTKRQRNYFVYRTPVRDIRGADIVSILFEHRRESDLRVKPNNNGVSRFRKAYDSFSEKRFRE